MFDYGKEQYHDGTTCPKCGKRALVKSTVSLAGGWRARYVYCRDSVCGWRGKFYEPPFGLQNR